MIKRSNGKTFANWLRTNFRKEDIMTILFSDDIDGVDEFSKRSSVDADADKKGRDRK